MKDKYTDDIILKTGRGGQFNHQPIFQRIEGEVFLGSELVGDIANESPLLGLCVDLGTTTIVVSLIDLESGAELAIHSGLNPQSPYGSDVMSRITAIIRDITRLNEMQTQVLDLIRELGESMCEELGVSLEAIYSIVVSSNSVMNHILLGVSPEPLGIAPYQVVYHGSQMRDFAELGFEGFGAGKLVTIPNISAFVGGDTVAGILLTNLHAASEVSLFVDVGTNGEIVLKTDAGLYATSCAAGPALEGMNLSCGISARVGAIEECELRDGALHLQVIGHELMTSGSRDSDSDTMEVELQGICGSGILALIREFICHGLITSRGRIADPVDVDPAYRNLIDRENRRIWVDKPQNIYVSQQDIRLIQLAKGAILSGIQVLIAEAGISADEVERVYIAGQFGSHIKSETFATVGILPQSLNTKIDYIGNSSIRGSYAYVLDRANYETAEELEGHVTHINLARATGYDRIFARATLFD